jgi:hypothetical protein
LLVAVAACGAGAIDGEPPVAPDAGAKLPNPDPSDAAVGDASPPGPRPDAGPMPTAETGGTIELPACGYAVTTRSGATAPWVPGAGEPAGADPTPYQVHLGIAGDAARSMVILWRTLDNTTLGTQVRYGIDSTSERLEEGFTFAFRSGAASDSPRIRMHEAHLCGLEPDTIYKYQVGTDGGWSPEYTFRTAPDVARDPSAQVTIAVLGDSRGGQSHFASLLAAAESNAPPDVIFFTGDAVTQGNVQREWDAFFNLASGILPYVPLVLANGNHEANAINFYAQLAMPGNEEWFGLDYGPVHLTVLNDSPRSSTSISTTQREFFDEDAGGAAGAPWRMLMHHKSMWSASGGHGSNTTLQQTWGPIVDRHDLDLVVSGHDHNYERTKPLRGGQVVADGEGTVYVVAGGAGAPLYAAGTRSFTAYSESRRHYVVVEARAGSLTGRAFRDDGSVMDRFQLAK